NDKLSSFDATFEKFKAKGKERNKKIKSLTKSLDNLHAEVARLSVDLYRATVLEAERDEEILHLKATPLEFTSFFRASVGFECGLSMHQTKEEFVDITEHAVEPLSVILQLEPEKLACPANVSASKDARVSPPVVKESTVTPAFASLKLPSNTMTDRATDANLGSVFVQRASHAVDDDVELTLIGSKRVSSSPSDVLWPFLLEGKVMVLYLLLPSMKREGARGMPENICRSKLGEN
ncbi:hypothetical protein Tco_1214816, partial [Tanacetum coccineum]